eukprot:TRINITY_DN10406_c0_g2_i3.p1 TRINITY_DN10406_c0_g2~~TRINITY_DN10406_c0_g2_i3.p1  ORF type:complete len:109 (+),score=8.45 TRINITY_DN10406_c0_g2_i3:41-367(+)
MFKNIMNKLSSSVTFFSSLLFLLLFLRTGLFLLFWLVVLFHTCSLSMLEHEEVIISQSLAFKSQRQTSGGLPNRLISQHKCTPVHAHTATSSDFQMNITHVLCVDTTA